MSKRFSYSIPTMTRRLLKIARPIRGTLWVSTLASIVGNLSQMGLMGFGALLLLSCGGMVKGLPWVYAGLMGISALLIVLGRYIEGVVSHAGAYRLLASMRVHLYESIRRLAPACLMERKKGDLLNIAVSDIETVEFFFAHTIGPMFTVILLPCVTLGLALWFHPLFAAVLLPVYLVVSIIFPLSAVKAGRGIGMRYRTRLGEMKSLVLESVYGLRDIQIFGFGPRRLEQVLEKNREVNQAAHGMTLHRQAVSTAPTFFVYLARILVIGAASWLAVSGAPDPVGTVVLSFVAAASFSSTQSLTMVVSSLLETYAAAERLFLLEDTPPEITEPAHPVSCGPIRSIQFDHVGFSYGNSSKAIL
ncbi:MAG: ABC transporter transmembrane domain-containing protein, partial [Neglectibacter timonensis]